MVPNSLGIPIMSNINDLENELNLSPSLILILTRNSTKYKYRKFSIPKKSGGKREIYAPVYSLKIVQRWILENILYKIKPIDCCYGFIKGQSNPLRNNASKHKKNIFILKIDLHDFFPSISSKKIYDIFSSIGYNHSVPALLTNICCCDNKLPQGAVTSPYLANLVCRKMDVRLLKYCNKRDVTYTRYADDLTFSCNDSKVLKKMFNIIEIITSDEGFQINKRKIHFMTPKCGKTVTGVTIINEELKAPKKMKRLVRSMIHRAIMTADYSNVDKIRGYVSYINSIENGYKDKIIKYLNSFQNKTITLFSDAVEAFNKNKLYKGVDDLLTTTGNDFVNENDAHEFESDAYYERREYMKNLGISLGNDEDIFLEDKYDVPF
jgi:RNA-directed DNA polymerase